MSLGASLLCEKKKTELPLLATTIAFMERIEYFRNQFFPNFVQIFLAQPILLGNGLRLRYSLECQAFGYSSKKKMMELFCWRTADLASIRQWSMCRALLWTRFHPFISRWTFLACEDDPLPIQGGVLGNCHLNTSASLSLEVSNSQVVACIFRAVRLVLGLFFFETKKKKNSS